MKVLEFEIEAVPGGTRVSARPAGRPSQAVYLAVDLAALASDVHGELARSVPPIDVFDAPMVEAERSAGRRLGELLGTPVPNSFLDQNGRGDAILVVHARGPLARGLPWELLRFGDGEPAEEVRGRAAVVRVEDVGGARSPEPADALEVALWCPDLDDAFCASVVSELEVTLSELGIPCVSPHAPVAARHRRIVHVVGNNAWSDALFGVVRADSVETGAVPAILDSLGPVTGEEGVAGVVLDVRVAGPPGRGGADLPRALLAAGCPAVRSPQAALSAKATVAANERFYDALVQGSCLAWATRAARQAVRSLGLGRMDSRWHQLRLLVGQVDARSLGRPVRLPGAPPLRAEGSMSGDSPFAGGKSPAWAVAWGVDAFGEWATFVVDAPWGQVAHTMRWVPGGTFWMGSEDGEGFDREHPRHLVELSSGFWLGESPATQELYEAVTGKNPSLFAGEPGTSKHQRPVERVSWHEARACCDRLNQVGLSGEGSFRLPSEAEWERAAKGGAGVPPWGARTSDAALRNLAWFDQNAGVSTHPVKKKRPNPYGLFDMLGNVGEWCEDAGWRDYSHPIEADPAHHGDHAAPRVIRGGAWGNPARDCRSAYRVRGRPSGRWDDQGFRLAHGPALKSKPGA